MTVKVKICGLRSAPALDAAIQAGADYFGLVFYPRSARNIATGEARALVERAAGRVVSVALLVDPDDAAIEDVVRQVSPAMLQLHGAETPERVAEIRAQWELPVIKAIRVGSEADARASIAYDGLDAGNVAAAIAATGARFVDVSSGVESAPGEKDPEMIRGFIAAARVAGERRKVG